MVFVPRCRCCATSSPKKGKGLLILIDEVRTSAAMREVAAVYQELVGDRKNVAIAMAGLPYAVSNLLNDSVLTFLNRATKVELGLISTNLIRAYYEQAFKSIKIRISDDILDRAALATHEGKALPSNPIANALSMRA